MGRTVIMFEVMTADDWPEARAIYVQGIATGLATFETEAPEWEEWNAAHMESCRLVAKTDGEIVGWAALSPVSGRCVYGGVAEVSVYVAETARGQGIGKTLLMALVIESEKVDVWTLQAGVFPENVDSIALHKSCGFREIGYRERIGQMQDGTWRDVVLLERRSETVGI
jgi:L-amino acid N-acyltransferase YncA